MERKKVANYEDSLVDGVYFKIQKRGGTFYEFYIYIIDHLDEVEYNPVILASKRVSLFHSQDASDDYNQFCDILSFAKDQLAGFFTSLFDFINLGYLI